MSCTTSPVLESFQSNCFGCDPALTGKLHSPFSHQKFDFTPDAYQKARSIVEEGESKLALLNEALERLTAQRDDVAFFVMHHRNYLAPISRLPDDVLLLIFKQLSRTWRLTNEMDEEPWNISAVCNRWRNLTLSQPRLWANIWFKPDPDVLWETTRLHCWRVELQLERSRHCTLNIMVDFTELNQFQTSGQFQASTYLPFKETLRTLLLSSRRSHTLELLGQIPHGWNVFPCGSPAFGSLERLCVTGSSWINKKDKMYLLDAPHLAHLTLTRAPVDPLSQINWATLQSLNLVQCNTTAESLLAVLNLPAGRLKSLALSDMQFTHMEDVTTTSPRPINLPQLHSADFTFSSRIIFDSILGVVIPQLRAPRLTLLHLQTLVCRTDFASVRQFVSGSGISSCLQQLELTMSSICTELISLLSELNSLLTLSVTMDSSYSPYTLLNALCWQTTPPDIHIDGVDSQEPCYRICPNLTSIGFSTISCYTQYFPLIAHLVRTRARSSKDEKSVGTPSFLEHFALDRQDIAGLEPLVNMQKEGLICLQ